jgi:hypothetical protein
MEFSPRLGFYRNRLYRKRMFAVILAGMILPGAAWLGAQVITPQYGRKAAPDKGPRALGLVQLSAKGKARIIPITIMMDGKFYDAGAYKADPVPMALDFGIVYEGFRSGVTQGLFTITQPGQLNHTWIAEGKWLPAGAIDPQQKKKYSPPVIAEDEKDDRPVLHRRAEKTDSGGGSDSKNSSDSKSKDSDKDKDRDKDKDKGKDDKAQKAGEAPASSNPASSTSAPNESTPSSSAEVAKASPPPAKASANSSDETIQDPNRPRLRRGKPDPSERHEPFTTFAPLADVVAGSSASGARSSAAVKTSGETIPVVNLIPAISDAGGPDPRPYTYDVKPAEEAMYRNKMLDLAGAQLLSQASPVAKQGATTRRSSANRSSANRAAAKSAAPPKPSFDDVTLRIFDLSNSNEPVLVLSAKTHPLAESAAEPKEITLIARTNLEGELRKLFFSETDSRHLDVTPRMELVDAVDADGDGRGELLFRRTFDDGSAYGIYRVSADRLWPLFEGTP